MPRKNPKKTIKEWMGVFQNLYGEADKDRLPEQIWIATMAHCSTIGESIRKFHFQELTRSSAHTFCWICSFVNKCNIATDDDSIFKLEGSLSDWVSAKYPDVCGLCEESSCCCKAKDMDMVTNKSGKYKRLYEKKSRSHYDWDKLDISGWQSIFNDIFGQRIHAQSFESIGFHFLEEVGECARAVRALSQLRYANRKLGTGEDFFMQLTTYKGLLDKYEKYHKKHPIPKPGDPNFKKYFTSKEPEIIKSRIVHAKMDMVIEIADTFSWFCSILNKANEIANNIPTRLPLLNEKLFEIYTKDGKFVCPTCEDEKCHCSFFTSENSTLSK